ncbi:hypothetical protein V2J09_005011 [Rumex salicifolius]
MVSAAPTSIILIIVFSVTQAIGATPHFIYANCTTANNYTANSFYKTNLNKLLPELTAQSSSAAFYNQTTGSDSDEVHGLYYCRADLSLQDCSDCVKAAATQIVATCPSQKEAVIWYQECTLRYSNRSIFSVSDTSFGWLSYSETNVTNPSQFLYALASTVDELTQQAVSANATVKNYAKGKRVVTESQTVYCLVQCTPDLNSTQCNDCLQMARYNIRVCCGSGRVYAFINFPSCRIMYDIVPFGLAEDGAPSPSPTTVQFSAPSSGKDCLSFTNIQDVGVNLEHEFQILFVRVAAFSFPILSLHLVSEQLGETEESLSD